MATPALRFDKRLIGSLPTPVALALQQLTEVAQSRRKDGQDSLNLLWQAADAVEAILRLFVFIAIAELHQQNRLDAVAAELVRVIDRPTMGQWYRLVVTLVRQLGSDTMLPELKLQLGPNALLERFLGGDPKIAGAKDNPLQSFLALRNRLAHGAGLSHEAATVLFKAWEEPIGRFLGECLWLRELSVVGHGVDGRQYHLRGLVPEPLEAADDDSRTGAEMVSVTRAGHVLQVWPLVCYGLPQLTDGVDPEPAVQLYSRRSAINTLQYTPLGTSAYWSFGDQRATNALDEILKREQLAAATTVRAVGAAASFADEMFRDSRLMIGREKELRRLGEALETHRGQLLWLFGEPGSGKSTLMAKFAIQLLDQTDAGDAARKVLPFRFKVGDSRCSAQMFFQLIEQALDPALAQSSDRDYSVTSTAKSLKAIAAKGIDCVLLLDGLDEIDSIDQRFIDDVCLRLVNELKPERLGKSRGRITWMCAGRGHLTARMEHGGAVHVFENGLPGMEKPDIRAMLLDRVGKARERLLKLDRIAKHKAGQIAAEPGLVAELDQGRVPAPLLALCRPEAESGGVSAAVAPRLRALVVAAGNRWMIDDIDNQDEMYFVELDRGKSTLKVHVDRVESPFIDAIAERSNGLPIYVRCVVNDVLAGGDTAHFESRKLPLSLEAFYQQLAERSKIGDIATLLTPLVCLIAVSRESISDQQLAERARDHLRYREEEDVSHDVATALVHLSPMLRRAQDRRKVPGYMLYHKSFRDYLDPPEGEAAAGADVRFGRSDGIRKSIFTAKRWLCDKCSEAAEHGVAQAGLFADYVAHHGVDHLLEIDGLDPKYNGIARALRLYARLAQGTELADHEMRPAALTVMAKRIADAVNALVEEMRDGEGDTQRRQARDRAAQLPIDGLLVLIRAVYETSTRKGAIRVLAELHSGQWDALRQELHSPYDMVLRVDTGEVLAELWEDANGKERDERMRQLVAMAADPRLEEREVAGYALAQLYLEAPESIDVGVVGRAAAAEINVERMILGELFLGLAGQHPDRARWLEAEIPPSRYAAFWRPAWDYHRIDLDTYRVLMTAPENWPALAADTDNPSLAASALEVQRLQDHVAALRARPSVRAKAALNHLLTAEGFAALGRDASAISDADGDVFEQLRALLEGGDRHAGLDILKTLMAHPLWQVWEAAASALERLVVCDNEHMSLIDRLVKDRSANWRVCYATIDAAYNVGGRDDFRLFESAVKLHARHPSSRVRGICADDFLAWLRMADEPMRIRILSDPELCAVVRFWVATADDCWLLEYAYLIVRLLKELNRDVAPFLEDGVSPFLQGDRPFYECERDELLLRIERNRAAVEARSKE
jgi:NACHT domain